MVERDVGDFRAVKAVLPATFAQANVLPGTLMQSDVVPSTVVESTVLHPLGGRGLGRDLAVAALPAPGGSESRGRRPRRSVAGTMIATTFLYTNVVSAIFVRTDVVSATFVQMDAVFATFLQPNVLHAPWGER